MRECRKSLVTLVIMTSVRYNLVINPDYAWAKPEIESWIKNGIPADAEVIFKQRNTVYRINCGGQSMIVKSFRLPNAINKFVYTRLRKSKAYRSYYNSLHLIKLGFLSPTPIAYAEVKRGGMLAESYYISAEVEGNNIRHWESIADLDSLLAAFAADLYRLHEAGVWHKDFSPGNVIYSGNASDGYKFNYIDVNRMEFNVHDRRKLMSMFRSINEFPQYTAKFARLYARAAGVPEEIIIREAAEAQARYFAKQRRKKAFKKLFK